MKKRLLTLVLCLLLTALTAVTVFADDLDAIRAYDIIVEPNDDGTLNMSCYFEWEVLDSESDGPLTWVHIGIPNSRIHSVKALSSNIDDIEQDGSYIDVYFEDEYEAGEVVYFGFSWVQESMYTLRESGTVTYRYTPGWFEEILVDRMTLTWSSDGVRDYAADYSDLTGAGSDVDDGENIVLTAENLGYGDRVSLTVTYGVSRFPNIDASRSADQMEKEENRLILLVVLGIFVPCLLVIAAAVYSAYRNQKDPHYWTGGYEDDPDYVDHSKVWFLHHGRGFMPPPGSAPPPPPPPPPSSNPNRGSGSCACACACAGGGRAGCSRKNILGSGADLREVRAAIERKENP